MSSDSSQKATPLQTAFSFTSADLGINQQGTLSPPQIAYLKTFERRATWFLIGVMAVLVGLPLLGLLYFVSQRNLLMIGFFIFLLVGLPFVGYWLASPERDKWRIDLRNNHVDTVYGAVELVNIHNTSPGGAIRHTLYRLKVENCEFAISEDQRDALENGTIYTVYYTPRSLVVLSLEKAKPDDQ
jgi:hypothetical protein